MAKNGDSQVAIDTLRPPVGFVFTTQPLPGGGRPFPLLRRPASRIYGRYFCAERPEGHLTLVDVSEDSTVIGTPTSSTPSDRIRMPLSSAPITVGHATIGSLSLS